MAECRLKIFRGPEQDALAQVSDSAGRSTDESTVTVAVANVLPLLADAIEQQRTWLSDFEDDEITISSDLYEVLQAYRFFRRPSA